MFPTLLLLSALVACLFHSTSAFSTQHNHFITNKHGASSTSALMSSRRVFLDATIAAAVTGLAFTAPAFAESDDLAMPSEAEQKQSDENAMKEKLQRKAELQKAAAKPIGFKENMEAEKRKQDSLKKSQTERRNALCEELGRGC